jgi:hypothetical protein
MLALSGPQAITQFDNFFAIGKNNSSSEVTSVLYPLFLAMCKPVGDYGLCSQVIKHSLLFS